MPARAPVPPELVDRVFSTRQAQDLGLPRDRLRATDIRRIRPGLHAHGDAQPSELAEAAALRYWRPRLWLSHASAARRFDLWAPRRLLEDARLHVCVPAGRPPVRAGGIAGRQRAVGPREVLAHDGVPYAPRGLAGWVTTPGRTWLDLAPELSVDQLVVIADQLVRHPYPRLDGRREPWETRAGLAALLGAHAGARGLSRAREALALGRVGADSPQETRLRLALVRAGLPEPELQINLDPASRTSVAADMGYRAHRIAVHYEGAYHRTPEQLERDIRRDECFTASGWRNYRFTREDARQGFQRAVVVLGAALTRP
ncbi:hypothetical protein [Zhihengliuella sp.]|uniref:hypothetical protein n=1 Tax=Zhihengliuella sp. TaxID=1954483 RepID=UPI002810D4B3|nr:hypothetical protein [Zhihengliuella sp.]